MIKDRMPLGERLGGFLRRLEPRNVEAVLYRACTCCQGTGSMGGGACPACGATGKAGLIRRGMGKNTLILASRAVLGKSLEFGDPDSGAGVKQCSVGTGTTAPAQTDVDLQTEIEIKDLTSWDNSGSTNDPPEFVAVCQFQPSEAIGNITEAGLWVNAPSSGDVFHAHSLFSPFDISAVTQANPGVVTATGHTFVNGDRVKIVDVGGMIQLNGNIYTVANVASNTFELSGTDTSGFTAYSSGGRAMKVFEKDGLSIFQVNWTLTY